MPLGNNIKALMELRHTTYSQLASHCGNDAQSIQQLVKRDSHKSRFTPEIAIFFNVPIDLLVGNDTTKLVNFVVQNKVDEFGKNASTHQDIHHLLEQPRMPYISGIPILKVADTAAVGVINVKQSSGTLFSGRLSWPSDDPSAYAIRIGGHGLSPRCRHNELIVVSPGAPVKPGDEVIVTVAGSDQPTRVYVFSYVRDGMCHFEDINGTFKPEPIEEKNIISMEFICGFAKNILSSS